MTLRFSKVERLRNKQEFDKVFRKGRRRRGSFVALHYIYNGGDLKRLGITVSKRVDKRAVVRNRLKRRLREIFRTNKELFPNGYDYVLRALPKSGEALYGELKDEILSLVKFIGSEKTDNPDNQIL
jgi:ribonuclease P protein component